MKTFLLLASLLPLATGHAQTSAAPSSPAKATAAETAEKRSDSYKGPKVVDNSKALGQKMIQQSKLSDGLITPRELGHKMIQQSKPADGLPKQGRPRPTQPL